VLATDSAMSEIAPWSSPDATSQNLRDVGTHDRASGQTLSARPTPAASSDRWEISASRTNRAVQLLEPM
jgi:hypothetical protein